MKKRRLEGSRRRPRSSCSSGGEGSPPRAQATTSDLASRIVWVQRIVPVAFILGCLLSVRLWLTARSYPLTPLGDSMPAIPFPLDTMLFVALVFLLAGMALFPTARGLSLALFAVILVLGGADQSRWQPWVYQYTAMLVAMACYSWAGPGVPRQQALLQMCRVIVASIYFWSGLQKTNAGFMFDEVPALVSPLLRLFPEGKSFFSYTLGVLAPTFEIAVGIGLVTRRWRMPAVVGAVSMHAMILVSLVVRNHNSVVWPWNAAMMALDIALFWRTPAVMARDILRIPSGAVHKALTVLFVAMPLLSFSYFDVWDAYLSAALYSGNTIAARIFVNEETERQLPKEIRRYVEHSIPPGVSPSYLDLNRWSLRELNVPFYPEPRIYRNVAKQICRYAANPNQMWLGATEKPSWPSRGRIRRVCTCTKLAQSRDLRDCDTY